MTKPWHADLPRYYQRQIEAMGLDERGLADGERASITVKAGRDIDDLWAGATGKTTAGFQTLEGKVNPSALVIHVKGGTATSADVLAVTFDVEVIENFQTHAVSGCTLRFVSATKE